MTLWIRRTLAALGVFVALSAVFAGLSAPPARAEPIPAPRTGIVVGCGFLDVVTSNVGPGDQEYTFYDNGKQVWQRLLLAENEFREKATEGHTYRLVRGGGQAIEVVYHRPAVCDSARLKVTISAQPVCPPRSDLRVHNGGAATLRVSAHGSWGQFVDFVEIAAGADHDFTDIYGGYVALDTPGGKVLYSPVPAPPPSGCGKFTSKLTALCGGKVRWDVGSDAIGPQNVAIFREFGTIPYTPKLVWSATLPAHGKLTAYGSVVKDDIVLAVQGGVREGTQDPYVDQVLSQIDKYTEPAACAKPEQATATFKATCTGATATITNFGAEREFTVTAADKSETVKIASGGVATVKLTLTAGTTAAVAVSGKDAFATHTQRACPSGGGGGDNGGSGGGNGGPLPITGAPAAWVALGGVVLLLAGAGLMLAARRRRA